MTHAHFSLMPEFGHRAIKRAVVKRALRLAILKDSKAYERLHKQLTEAMTKAFDDQLRKGVADALDRMRDFGPGKFSAADAKAIMATLESAVGGPAMVAALRAPVINLSDSIVRVGAGEVGAAAAVDIAFNRADLDALDLIKRGNLFPVQNSWDSVTRDRISPILNDYFSDGMTRQDLAARFAKDFSEMADKSRVYWELLADHVATKTREMGRVTGYQRAGAQFVEIRAQLDDQTTEICRALHGRIIPVSKLVKQRESYLAAVDQEDQLGANDAWEMHGSDTDFSETRTNSLPASTGSPPYHFRCRTITVIYFPPAQPNAQTRAKQAIVDREPVSAADAKAIRANAAKADWPNARVLNLHYGKHKFDSGAASASAYTANARDLAIDPASTMRLSIRRDRKTNASRLVATFSTPAKSPKRGRAGHLITSLDVESNVLTSHHYRRKLGGKRDDVPAKIISEKALRRFLKWLTD